MKLKPNVAYHCKTMEAFEEWIRIAKRQGLKCELKSYHWQDDKEKTCVRFKADIKMCTYGSIDCYQSQGIEIVEFTVEDEDKFIGMESISKTFQSKQKEEEWKPEWSEDVEFSYDGKSWFYGGIFVAENPSGVKLNWIVLDEERNIKQAYYIRKQQRKQITPKEAEEMLKSFGVEVEVK